MAVQTEILFKFAPVHTNDRWLASDRSDLDYQVLKVNVFFKGSMKPQFWTRGHVDRRSGKQQVILETVRGILREDHHRKFEQWFNRRSRWKTDNSLSIPNDKG